MFDSLSAQQNGGGHGRRGGSSVLDQVARVKDLNLTDDQKAKLAELKKEYAPKIKELSGTFDKVLTADQKKARDDATKAAKDAGKSRREIFQAGMAAVKLTDAQKAKLADGRKAMQTLNKEITDQVNKVLTPDQQDVLKKARASRGNRRNRGNRGSGDNKQPAPVT